ncbi:MAG: aa3-type cytochrome c oxidase subunit IV [Alphaproteobacteria bacterium]|nr:aa3-type cytochrome c oxidase subunit IV [Alphaproteobacteria bacterium]
MAEHAPANSHGGDTEEHRSTYEGFVAGSVALCLICAYILVALVCFAFVGTGNLILGFGGLIVGLIAVTIDTRTGGRWLLSSGLLVIYGLITAVALS